MSNDNKLPTNEQIAQYLDQEVPLKELNDLLNFEIKELEFLDFDLVDLPDFKIDLIEFDIKPISDLGGNDDK